MLGSSEFGVRPHRYLKIFTSHAQDKKREIMEEGRECMKHVVPWMVGVLALPEAGLLAQGPMERLRPPSIQTVGEATVMAKPDEVQMDIGVVTEAPSAEAAAAQN